MTAAVLNQPSHIPIRTKTIDGKEEVFDRLIGSVVKIIERQYVCFGGEPLIRVEVKNNHEFPDPIWIQESCLS